jgi:hypothetical protein
LTSIGVVIGDDWQVLLVTLVFEIASLQLFDLFRLLGLDIECFDLSIDLVELGNLQPELVTLGLADLQPLL